MIRSAVLREYTRLYVAAGLLGLIAVAIEIWLSLPEYSVTAVVMLAIGFYGLVIVES